MAEKILMKGNEAVAEAALRAGCRLYFAYPITPQNELVEYMSKMMPKIKGTFIQAESEVAAINMVYGAAGCGKRAMTSSSSPGVSLKMEGISYIAGAQLPAVIINVSRGGPGLGDIQPSQGDYFQATKGGGHGDYRSIVLAPASVQEFADMASEAFDLADKYRIPVILLADGILAQMMEPVKFKPYKTDAELEKLAKQHHDWCIHPNVDGKNRHHNEINSLEIDPKVLEKHVLELEKKYQIIEKKEVRVEKYNINPNNEMVCVAFGTSARIVKSAVDQLNNQGHNIGIIRPITVWPFPYDDIAKAVGKNVKNVCVFELNLGQMVEDVKLAVKDVVPVHFMGKVGGIIFTPAEIEAEITKHLKGKVKATAKTTAKAKTKAKTTAKATTKAKTTAKATTKAKTTAKVATKAKTTAKATSKATTKPKATAKVTAKSKATAKPKATTKPATKPKTTAKMATKPKATTKATTKPKTTKKVTKPIGKKK